MKADLILRNARIFTVDPARPWAEAAACVQGRFLAVGSNQELAELAGPKTQLIDAGGRLVLPGLIDAHVHTLQYAIRSQEVNLFGLRDVAEVRRRVRQAVEQAQPGQWVQGLGWDEHFWDVSPSADLLDDIAPDTPVVLRRMDMHTWWVNKAVMRRVGLTRDTQDPPDSRLDRDAAGNPTGILREWNAIRLVEPYIPEPDETTLQSWLKDAIAEMHRLGLTGIHDQRMKDEGRQSFQMLQTLHRQGELNLRVHMHLAAEFLTEADTLGLQPGFGDERLWIGHVKAFADGSLGSRTAAMLAPLEGEPDNKGVVVTTADQFWQLIEQADRAGFPVSIHAIGDRAVRDVLDVLSEFEGRATVGKRTLPHRIEHVQVIHPTDLPRLGKHGIVASVQPVHLMTDWSLADQDWGQRSRYAYAFRSLLNHGTWLAFGSDAPVAPLNPMLGLCAAVTRQDDRNEPPAGWYPEERLTVGEAIHGYTAGPAYTAGKQHLQGSITPGKWADMIVLSRNLFEIPPAEIAQVEVEQTIFAGQVIYRHK